MRIFAHRIELYAMAKWYEKYLSIYGKSYKDIPDELLDRIKQQLALMQSTDPLVSVVVIAYNEEKRLTACLWSLSELQTKCPIEILGVNNNSSDRTEEVYERLGLRRNKQTAIGDAKKTVDSRLVLPDVSCVSSFWSFFPDETHSALGLHLFEMVRDAFLYVQHFKRPELCVRGMVFAFNAEYAKKVKIRTDIRRGEDGSLALSLKPFGKIAFLYNRNARPVTGYGTIGSQSLWQSFVQHVRIQGRGITRIFFKKDHYEDSDENLVKPHKD